MSNFIGNWQYQPAALGVNKAEKNAGSRKWRFIFARQRRFPENNRVYLPYTLERPLEAAKDVIGKDSLGRCIYACMYSRLLHRRHICMYVYKMDVLSTIHVLNWVRLMQQISHLPFPCGPPGARP